MAKRSAVAAEKAFESPFRFSSYVLLNPLGASQNPLGLMSAQTKLARQVFPQFTVLSNHPRYHSILCGIIYALQELGKEVNARSIRECEILWGLAQAIRSKRDSDSSVVPLNIRRYNLVLDSDKSFVTIDAATHSSIGLLDRLGYGVWGFYANPSRQWSLLDEARAKLRPLGHELGEAYVSQTGFYAVLQSWLSGKRISKDDLYELSKRSGLEDEKMRSSERIAWKKVFKEFRAAMTRLGEPERDAVWNLLPSEETAAKWLSEKEHPRLTERLLKGIKEDQVRLKTLLESQRNFDHAVAWLEFLFEFEFVKAELGNADLSAADRSYLFEQAQAAIAVYERERNGMGSCPELFRQASQCRTGSELRQVVISVHSEVQKKKGKSPYLTLNGTILQPGALPPDRVVRVLERLEGSTLENAAGSLLFNYRRDWHVLRAARYLESFQ